MNRNAHRTPYRQLVARGNALCVYKADSVLGGNMIFTVSERPIYGAQRLGTLTNSPVADTLTQGQDLRLRQGRQYISINHLPITLGDTAQMMGNSLAAIHRGAMRTEYKIRGTYSCLMAEPQGTHLLPLVMGKRLIKVWLDSTGSLFAFGEGRKQGFTQLPILYKYKIGLTNDTTVGVVTVVDSVTGFKAVSDTLLGLNQLTVYSAGRVDTIGWSGGSKANNYHKLYELTDHLGNVRAVVRAAQLAKSEAWVATATDYYPFGMRRWWATDSLTQWGIKHTFTADTGAIVGFTRFTYQGNPSVRSSLVVNNKSYRLSLRRSGNNHDQMAYNAEIGTELGWQIIWLKISHLSNIGNGDIFDVINASAIDPTAPYDNSNAILRIRKKDLDLTDSSIYLGVICDGRQGTRKLAFFNHRPANESQPLMASVNQITTQLIWPKPIGKGSQSGWTLMGGTPILWQTQNSYILRSQRAYRVKAVIQNDSAVALTLRLVLSASSGYTVNNHIITLNAGDSAEITHMFIAHWLTDTVRFRFSSQAIHNGTWVNVTKPHLVPTNFAIMEMELTTENDMPSVAYRWGFNTQEKSFELSPSGNLYTAPYWLYDARTIRRHNLDPVITPSESGYLTFKGNPILYSDKEGDCPDCPKSGVSGGVSVSATFSLGSKGKSNMSIGFGAGISANSGNLQGSLNLSGRFYKGGLGTTGSNNSQFDMVASPAITFGMGSATPAKLNTFNNATADLTAVTNSFNTSGSTIKFE